MSGTAAPRNSTSTTKQTNPDREADLRRRKRLWRTALKAHRSAKRDQGLTGVERDQMTVELKALLGDQIKPGYVIATYTPFGAEPDVSGFTDFLLEKGAVVLVPDLSVSPDGRTIPFRQIGETRKPAGQWDPPGEIRTIIVPSLALDANGVRLGRGAGWYDRALRRFASMDSGYRVIPTLVGICYDRDFQEDGGLPAEDHDQYLDFAVTEVRTVKTQR